MAQAYPPALLARAERLGSGRRPMGGLSIWHWLVVIVVVMLLFGRGKISDLMGDVAKGVKSFKKGLADDDEAATATVKPLESKAEEKSKV
jgi:sec-independent protein translocase protein TatA